MPEKTVALKIDVDTYAGTLNGIPVLLDLLEKYEAKGTFYLSMGPDHTGRALKRIFTHKGFLKKALSSGAPSAYGIKTMLYGWLLPGPVIFKKCADVMRAVKVAGHELGVHAWNHVQWHDHLIGSDAIFARSELGQAANAFRQVTGELPTTVAAPGWTVSEHSLAAQDLMNLAYCSDCRGTSPFYPVMNNVRFKTLQIPTTLPTADELLGRNGLTPDLLPEYYLNQLKPGLNVHTIHTELEGGVISRSFADLLARLQQEGISCISLAEAAASAIAPPCCHVEMRQLEGRALPVAMQMEAVCQ